MNQEKPLFSDSIKRNALPFVLALILVIVLTIAGNIMLELNSTTPVWICIGFLILLVAYSWISSYALIQRIQKSTLSDTRDKFLLNKEKAIADFEHYMKDFTRELYSFYIWLAICALLTLLLCFLSAGISSLNFDLYISVTLICFYIFWGLFAWAIPTDTHMPQDLNIIPEDEYPELYQMVKNIFSDEKLPPLLLYGNANNVGVLRYGKRIFIQLGALLAGILTKEELQQILLHEKGHVVTAEQDSQMKVFRMLSMHAAPSEYSVLLLPADFVIFGMLRKLGIMASMSEASVSAEKERRADRFACVHGNPSMMASGLMKTRMLQLYQTYEDEVQGCYYEPENTPRDVLEKDLTKFHKVFDEKKDFWFNLILHEQSPALDSHPYFAERYDNIGKPKFDLLLPDYSDNGDHDAYSNEIRNLVRQYGKLHYEINKDDYAERRQKNWLEPLASIQKYQQETAAGKEYSLMDLRDVITNCYLTNQFELMEKLCRETIHRSDNDHEEALAHFYLGLRLIHKYDKEGVQHLYQAADANKNYFDEACELIGEFLLLMNLKKELDEYRIWYLSKGQDMVDIDYDEISHIGKRDKLSEETTLSPEKQNENLIFIRQTTGDHLNRLYQVHKTMKKGFYATIYVVEFVEGTSDQDADACMDRIFQYLDQQEEQYALLDWREVRGFKVGQLPGLVYEKF